MPEARKLSRRGPTRGARRVGLRRPALPRRRTARGRAGAVVLLTVDLDKSDLPLQTAFPIMVANPLGWFGGTKGELREAVPAGSVAQVKFPWQATGDADSLHAPDGREQPLSAAGGPPS